MQSGRDKVMKYLDSSKIEVDSDMLNNVATSSWNNDKELGTIIAEAYTSVGKDGVVLMEGSGTDETYVDTVDGIQFDCALTSPHFVTNTDKQKAELDNPLVLICTSEIPNMRKIQNLLEHVIKQNRSRVRVATVSQQDKSSLLLNNVKGSIKENIMYIQ